ncbi:MAG: CoA transferase [Geminicoccaceae bacterium]
MPRMLDMLTDFGTDVIRIEAPAGADPGAGVSVARHGYDLPNLHRNKCSLTLNVREPEGQALVPAHGQSC